MNKIKAFTFKCAFLMPPDRLASEKSWSRCSSDDVTSFAPELLHQQGQEALSTVGSSLAELMQSAGDNRKFLVSGPSA